MSTILSRLLGEQWEIVDLSAFPEFSDPDETAESYVGNAVIKAEASSAALGETCIADDAGLEIDALGGAPGVHSKRFEGEATAFPEKIRRVLELLSSTPDHLRTARFRCAVAVAHPGLSTATFTSVCEGRIAALASGKGGFGYDPIFIPNDRGRTFAEMTSDEKHAISHRGKVLAETAAWLKSRTNW
jgi:XTP/dITP diphosphohydrolase